MKPGDLLCEHIPADLRAFYLEHPELSCARCVLEGRCIDREQLTSPPIETPPR